MKRDDIVLEKVEYLVGSSEELKNVKFVKPMKPFADIVVDFLHDLSKKLIKDGSAFSDVVTLGFWCRKASVLNEKNQYDDLDCRVGRGVTFHIAPSNVPVNFAFSLVTALLAGNCSIVRVPSKQYPQVDIIVESINELINCEYAELSSYIFLVKYSREHEINSYFSSLCHSRIIWGGDDTIQSLRNSKLNSRANEITFANRYSIALIDADAYSSEENKRSIAERFYNDTYFSDQNACSSPVVVFWKHSERCEEVKELFWENLHSLLLEKYEIESSQVTSKELAKYMAVASLDVKVEKTEDNLITRLKLFELSSLVNEYKCNSGFFFEYDINHYDEMLPILQERCQTLTYYGNIRDELKDFLVDKCPNGVDRVVPFGKSMDFSLIWDGYDLIRVLSRKIDYK